MVKTLRFKTHGTGVGWGGGAVMETEPSASWFDSSNSKKPSSCSDLQSKDSVLIIVRDQHISENVAEKNVWPRGIHNSSASFGVQRIWGRSLSISPLRECPTCLTLGLSLKMC